MLTCSTCSGLTPDGASLACLHCDAPLRIPPRWARRLSWVFGPVGAVLLAACYGPAGRYHVRPDGPNAMRVDQDGDGSLANGAACDTRRAGYEQCERDRREIKPDPHADCDDTDASRYPGAADLEGDGIDQNCDGIDGWRDPAVVVQPENATVPVSTPPGT